MNRWSSDLIVAMLTGALAAVLGSALILVIRDPRILVTFGIALLLIVLLASGLL